MSRKPPPQKPADPPSPPHSTESNPDSTPACAIAGFGASAGGLEAFTELLHKLPNDSGMAIVFVQHLDPKHSSVLTELLARTTTMPVVQITDGVAVEPNRVYIIPPNTNVWISNGALRVEPRQSNVPHMPIDRFFRSLAEEQGGKAIGVVLSGTASDGTEGLKAIKAGGGITFAQAPESAKYDGMPRSAISAGCVDFVLPPDGIAMELDRLCRHPYLSRPRPVEASGDFDAEFNEIYTLLRVATGVDFSYYKPGTIRRRTLRRMALLTLESPKEYVRYLREHRAELDLLFQDLLINVTGFFREPETFTAIRTRLLPNMLKARSPEDVFRVWVPGCSTGEEVYSIAITLLEYLRECRIEVPMQIFGTDLSEAALQKARQGAYPESIAADVSPDRLRRYFTHSDEGYRIVRLVRDVCVFARQNVTKDPPFSKLDLVTCRNLLIYLGPVLQSRVMRLFHYALRADGYLVLGASEHTGNTGERFFEPFDKLHRIYTRKAAPLTVTDFGHYEEAARHEAPHPPPPASVNESQGKVDRMILARYSPPSVVVNRALKILQFRGDTTAFLEPASGDASLDVVKLARAGLGPEIRRLVEKAESTIGPVKSEPITLAHDNHVRTFQIAVTRVHGIDEAQFLTVFEETAVAEQQPRPERPALAMGEENDRIVELERELASTRQYLQSVTEEQEAATEELQSAHEEVQSSNEELQSTNEELLTAKEELQSTNEELTTVNEEMQSRNVELQQTNNDLLNLLNSANIPILMLGGDLRIRRFTPQAKRILNLIPADLGRPISDFHLKINVPDLVPLCQEVIDTLASREREVQDAEGHAYSMWVRPYRTFDNRIEGVVLSLMDVTERRRSAEARYRRLFEAAKDGIVIVEATGGEIVDTNPFVTRLFGYSRAELVGKKYWKTELFRDTEMDESVLAEAYENEAVQRTVTLASAAGDRIETEIVASWYLEGERKVVQFNIRDITARRRMEERIPRIQAPAPAEMNGEPGTATETVLLVEYEATLRSMAGRFLQMQGYRVLEAASGPEALQIAREHGGPIHILVTAVVMPGMSGRELAFHLSPQRPEMKVLFTSGHKKDVVVHHGVLAKGFSFLEKPFTQDMLAARVRTVLDSADGNSEDGKHAEQST
ncbi:MAG: chemotaxis protein CheB [Candidatus Solibacter sp.]